MIFWPELRHNYYMTFIFILWKNYYAISNVGFKFIFVYHSHRLRGPSQSLESERWRYIRVLLGRGHWRREKLRSPRRYYIMYRYNIILVCQPSGSCALAHTQTRDGKTKQYTGKKNEKIPPRAFWTTETDAFCFVHIYILAVSKLHCSGVIIFMSCFFLSTYDMHTFVCVCANERVWENIALAGRRQEVSMYVARARV
jgi:hypothetical protein